MDILRHHLLSRSIRKYVNSSASFQKKPVPERGVSFSNKFSVAAAKEDAAEVFKVMDAITVALQDLDHVVQSFAGLAGSPCFQIFWV